MYNGTSFASKYEADVAKYLTDLGLTWEYEPVKIPWVPQVRIRYYKPDFKVNLPDGHWFYLETKGYFDPPARSKMIQIRRQYPDMDIRLMFMNDLVKVTSSLNYHDWALKHGYKLATLESLHNESRPKRRRRKPRPEKQNDTAK